MKLINRSAAPDELLEAVLASAGRRVGARTTGVVVKVNPGKGGGTWSSGTAYECLAVRWKRPSLRWIKTDGGAFRIVLPNGDPLASARSFYETAAHEWCHIREYQQGGRWKFPHSRKGPGGRRPTHRHRPEERRVAERLRETENEGRDENRDAGPILALALWLEAKREGPNA